MTIPSASVLLVDDDPDLLLTLGMVLENVGYTITTAADATHALRLAAQTDFQIALVNYHINGSLMDGLRLITRLHGTNPFIIPLLMTDHDKCEVGFRAAQVGVGPRTKRMAHTFSQSSRYRVAIIGGAGKQGLEYAHVLSRMPEWAEITAVIDPKIDQCQDEVYSAVGRCNSIEEAMPKYDFDVGLVAVPHYLHYYLTSMLLRMGKHVIKEKPFASNIQEAQELFSLSKEGSKKIFITTQRSHNAMFDSIQVAFAKIGSIYSFRYEYCKNFNKPTSGWRAVRSFSCGGVVLDMGYHVFDVILRLFGFPTRISAQYGYCFPKTRSEGLEDLAEILLDYADRQLQSSILLARHHHQKSEKLEIIGDRGFIIVESDRYSVYTKDSRLIESIVDHEAKDARFMLERFFAGLSDDTFGQREILINLDNMRLVDLVYRSARTHSTINLCT